jgi:transposase
MLMPADPREWLPPGHLAWKVLELAGEMDLSAFGADYRPDGQGGRPYDPVMMATLLLYGYCRGRRSSREIEMATHDDVGARIICGGLHPDHSTVAEFVRRHAAAIAGLLPESVKACAAGGLVDVSLVAGDGTILKANASKAGNLTKDQPDAEIAELEAWIEEDLRDWVQGLLGPDPGPDGPGDGDGGKKPKKRKKKPARAEQMLRARLEARARMEELRAQQARKNPASAARLEERITQQEAVLARREEITAARIAARAAREAAGKKIPGTRPLTDVSQDREVKSARAHLDKLRAQHQQALAGTAPPRKKRAARPGTGTRQLKTEADMTVSPADPSSRMMPGKKGGFDQSFNVQALATAKTQVILAIMRHDNPTDIQALLPLLAAARAVLKTAGITDEILRALSGTGYASDANFTAAIPETLYVAVTREARQAGRSGDGRDPCQLPSWQDMTARLDTPEGKALYKQRSATIEPVFAQLTARLGRTLHYRGDLAGTELALWAASHNTLKAIKARTRRPAVPAAA